MPPKAKSKSGRPRDAHQTEEKRMWRIYNIVRYNKNRKAWNAYQVKYNKKRHGSSDAKKKRVAKMERSCVRRVIKICQSKIKNFPKISL